MEKTLSVISQEEFDRDQENGKQYDTTKTYSGTEGKPFEIDVLFYQDHVRHDYDPRYAETLGKKTKDKIADYYFANIQGGRHPLVPRGEVLVKLGQKNEGGKETFYFVPESVAQEYSKESGVKLESREDGKIKKWEEIKKYVEQITDDNGMPIEKGILETVIALKASGIETAQSCEGHIEIDEGRRPWPWVIVEAPNKPHEQFVDQRKVFEEVAGQNGVLVENLERGNPRELWKEALNRASQNPETPEHKIWEDQNKKLYETTLEQLALFYKDREVDEDTKLKIGENDGTPFEISSEQETRFKVVSGELSNEEKRILLDKLPKRQQEMKAFAEFLKERFFAQ